MSLRSAIRPLHALAHETRWRIIELLLRRAMRVGHICGALQLPQSSVSEHLRIMLSAGVLVAERSGKQTCYRIADRFNAFIPLARRALGITESIDPRLGADDWNASRNEA